MTSRDPGVWVAAILAATAALTGACAWPSTLDKPPTPLLAESLDSVEIGDEPMALPATRLVICKRTSGEGRLFFWTGSNVLLPRRPLEEGQSDSVEVRFREDPLTLTSLALRLNDQRRQISVQWPDSSDSTGSARLTSVGPHRYALDAMVPDAHGETARPLNVRIEFHC
ncbi:MAG: hypothetical protein ACRDUX_32680 [Mycobacterium sp.]